MSAFEERLNKVMVATGYMKNVKEMKEWMDKVEETLRDEFSSATNQGPLEWKE